MSRVFLLHCRGHGSHYLFPKITWVTVISKETYTNLEGTSPHSCSTSYNSNKPACFSLALVRPWYWFVGGDQRNVIVLGIFFFQPPSLLLTVLHSNDGKWTHSTACFLKRKSRALLDVKSIICSQARERHLPRCQQYRFSCCDY